MRADAQLWFQEELPALFTRADKAQAGCIVYDVQRGDDTWLPPMAAIIATVRSNCAVTLCSLRERPVIKLYAGKKEKWREDLSCGSLTLHLRYREMSRARSPREEETGAVDNF